MGKDGKETGDKYSLRGKVYDGNLLEGAVIPAESTLVENQICRKMYNAMDSGFWSPYRAED